MKLTYLNYLDYAQQIISVTALMPKCQFLMKRRGFAYVRVPRHVSVELLKLHGTECKGKLL